MNKLALYNPLMETRDVDEWLEGFFKPLRSSLTDVIPSVRLTPTLPSMEIVENDKGSTVTLEIPGVDKKDVTVSIDKNEVVVNATTKRESEKKEGDRVVRSERYFGNIYRRFALDHAIDESKSVAKYDKGVLTLTLPKTSEAAAVHKLTVI